jgi:hypothetical protein
MLRFLKLICVIIVFALTGCSYIYGDKGIITNREKDYLQARNIPAICVPPGYSSSTIEAHFPVSDTEYPAECKKVVLIPPDLALPIAKPKPIQVVSREVTYRTPTGVVRTVCVPDYYFDSKTRAHGTPAGTPVGSLFNSIWPWNRHPTNFSASRTNTTSAVASGTAQKTPATNTSNANANSSGNNTNLAQNTNGQNLPDYDPDAEKEAKEKLLKQQYFDRYSRR